MMGAKPLWGEILRLVRAEGPGLGPSGPIFIQFDPLDCNFKGLKQGRSPLDLLGPKALCCDLQGL